MFNKSILAAALLTVGAIAGGSAVSAAEIGVRNTTGFSTRNVTGGQSSYVRSVTGQFRENSSGSVLEVNADRYSVRDVARSSGGEVTGSFDGALGGVVSGEVSLNDTEYLRDGLVSRSGTIYGADGDVDLNLDGGTFTGTGTLTEAPSSSSTGTVRDGDFRRASSSYTRNERGNIREVTRESFDFSGRSRSDFSELSTFSR